MILCVNVFVNLYPDSNYKSYIAIVSTAGGDSASGTSGSATITVTDNNCSQTTLFNKSGKGGNASGSTSSYSGYGLCRVDLITDIQNGSDIVLTGSFSVAGAVSLILLGIK